MDPDARRGTARGARLAPGGCRVRPGPRHPRGPALPPQRRDGDARRARPPVLGGARLRLRPRRPPRQRRVGRRAGGRVPPPGAGRPARGHRLDRRPAVVLGRRRHDRHLVGRLQQPAAGRPPPAGAQGDHHAHEHRRPLRRRRALQGRLRAGHGPAALEHLHAALAVPAAARGGGRRALARAVGTAARVHQALDPHLARAPAARRVLAARVRVRGLRGRRGARVRDRRLDRRLHEQRPAPARGARRAAQGPHRPVAPRPAAPRHARPGDRVPPGGAALVGLLAQRRRYGRDGRADAARLDAGVGAARAVDGRGAGALGRRRTRGRLRGWSRGPCGWTRTGCCAMRRTAPRPIARRRSRTARPAAASPSAAPSSAAPTPAPGAPKASRATSPPTSGRRKGSRSASPRRRCRGTWRSSATRGSRSASRATGRWRWSPPGSTTWRRAASPGSSPRRSTT